MNFRWTALFFLALFFLAGFGLSRVEEPHQVTIKRARIALGTLVEIEVRGLPEADAQKAVEAAYAEIQRIEDLLNQHAAFKAGSHQVPSELDALLAACHLTWQQSGGAFDCALAALVEAWGFTGGNPAIPAPRDLADALAVSGWRGIHSPAERLWVFERAASLAYGGLGKGYAVDRAVAVLREHGVREALVNAGGDLRTLGSSWTAAIQHPRQPGSLPGRLKVADMAAATSGDYEQFFVQDGMRYHHILDPRSGYPARDLQSVTVLAPTCLQADALSTAVFVLGVQDGLALVENLPQVEALLVDADGRLHLSSGFTHYWQGN